VGAGFGNGLTQQLRAWLKRYWRSLLRWRDWFEFSEEAFHLVMAGVVGLFGGAVNLVFFAGIESAKWLFLHNLEDPVVVAEEMDWVMRLLTPTLGGLAAGLVLHWGGKLTGKQGSTNLLEVVVAGDGRLPFRSGVVKALSSLMSIGSGASIGREGGITQLSATLASKWGQWQRWPPYRLRLLVGCGAAAGIAAAYNAPIAGSVFAAWIVLGNFSMNQFAPLALASVTATLITRSFFHLEPWYKFPAVEFTRLSQLPWFLFLGVLCGAMGGAFLKLLRVAEAAFGRLKLPLYAQLTLGGFGVGLIATEFPGVCGNGYEVINRILRGDSLGESFPLLFLLGLLAAKLAATLITVGSGAVGGVLTPTMFIGAGVGSVFGVALHQLGYGQGLPTALFTAVGMGATLAATTRAPLLAVILLFEISLSYTLMPPLLAATVVAVIAARRVHRESVYTDVLRHREGVAGRESEYPGASLECTVGDLMQPPVEPVKETASVADVAHRFLSGTNNYLPVVDGNRRLVGMVALHDLKEHLTRGEDLKGVIAFDVMRPPPAVVLPGQRLLEALPTIVASDLRNVPVVNNHADMRLVGAIVRAEAMGVVAEAMETGRKPGFARARERAGEGVIDGPATAG
jgi:CIC family chloride channel protein